MLLFFLSACGDQGLKVLHNNEPPVVSILKPLPEQSFVRGVDTIQVCGEGTDKEDTVVSLDWTLNDAVVPFAAAGGCGENAGGGELPELVAGTYLLRATGEDSEGESAFDEVTFVVLDNEAPTVEIQHPLDGDIWLVGKVGLLTAHAEDDTLPPASATWSTDLEGALGLSAVDSGGNTQLSVSFSTAGLRQLKVEVLDEDGQVGQDQIQLTVCGDVDEDGIGDCEDTEECDGLDNDGNGTVDDGFSDTDGDGTADCVDVEECDGLDNDGNGKVDERFPDTDGDKTADCVDVEECDGLDNDGNGFVDDGFPDTDKDGTADCVDTEECDGLDNNGNGKVDERFPDTDGDNIADCVDIEDCDGLDNDGDGAIDEGYADTDGDGTADCMDVEDCDGLDNDGDGSVDEGYPDGDGDGIADCVDIELCDGSDNNGDGLVDEGYADTDGDGTADCVDVEDCDGLDNDGDGLVDEGYADSDADGIADCVDTSTTVSNCSAYGTGNNALTNPDFETGSYSPWVYDASYSVITANQHGGSYGMEANGNHYLEQTFAAVPVNSLVKASFWTWHDGADAPAMSVEWSYSDGSVGSTFLGSGQLNGWVEVDLLPSLTRGKSLSRLRVWGYTGGYAIADITRFDDFMLCY